jgi:hypothetical protein
MSEVEELEVKVQNLTPEDFAKFRDWFMEFNNSRQQFRIPDLHPGAMTTTPDFDEPLPDSFWLGAQ